MSNRFKFRVWNTKINMYDDDRSDVFILLNQDRYMCLRTYNNKIIEQCTGLKDKNGNLIYEGDIVKDEFDRKFKVIWSEEDCMFDGRIIYYDPEFGTRFDLYQGATDDSEIIGNIHEQSEQKD